MHPYLALPCSMHVTGETSTKKTRSSIGWRRRPKAATSCCSQRHGATSGRSMSPKTMARTRARTMRAMMLMMIVEKPQSRATVPRHPVQRRKREAKAAKQRKARRRKKQRSQRVLRRSRRTTEAKAPHPQSPEAQRKPSLKRKPEPRPLIGTQQSPTA